MLDQIIPLISSLGGGLGGPTHTKFSPPSSVAAARDGSGLSFEAVEFREGFFTDLLQAIGLIDPPATLKYQADADGVLLSTRTGREGNFTNEVDIFVARKNVLAVARSYTKPRALLFIIIGIATVVTIIGPIIALLLYLRQKHTASFGFDTDLDIGLVISFVGGRDLDRQLQPLWDQGKQYVLEGQTSAVVTPTSTPGPESINMHWADPPQPDPIGTYDVEPGKILVQLNGQVQSLTKQQLTTLARQGKISPSDQVSIDGRKWLSASKVRGLFS